MTIDENIKNTKVPQNAWRAGLKRLLGDKLSDEQLRELQAVFNGIDEDVRRRYAGKVGYILSRNMSSENGATRFYDILKNDGIDFIQGPPDGPNINDAYWSDGEEIFRKLNDILEG